MNIFEQAARQKLRFTTPVGMLTTEQVFDLPLENSRAQLDLDRLAQMIDGELSATSTKSFVKKTTDRNKVAQLRMDIVLHIIATKVDAKAEADKRATVAAERARLTDALTRAKDAALGAMSEADILKALAALDAPAVAE